MKPLRSLVIAALTLVALSSCAAFSNDVPIAAPTATPVAAATTASAAPSSSPADTRATAVLCRYFDSDFDILTGDAASAAQQQLKSSYAKPGPAVEKLKAVLVQYAGALEESRARAVEQKAAPELIKAFAEEAEAARMTIRVLEGMMPQGEQIHIFWTRYYLHTGADFVKLCPEGSLPHYRRLDSLRAEWK